MRRAVPAQLSPASASPSGEGSSPWLAVDVSSSFSVSRRARFSAAFSAFFRSRCRFAKLCWFFLAIRYLFAAGFWFQASAGRYRLRREQGRNEPYAVRRKIAAHNRSIVRSSKMQAADRQNPIR